MYELRHPCIVNILAWYKKTGSMLQYGVVMEKCDGGELGHFYTADKYEVPKGMQVILDTAHGLAYMHSFAIPIVHRDIKSANVLVTGKGRGKLADCGESRRVDYNSTMTRKGSPLWAGGFCGTKGDDCGEQCSLLRLFAALLSPNKTLPHPTTTTTVAPELLAGKRFTEKVDVWSFGVLMLEVVNLEFPYPKEREWYKKSRMKGMDMDLLRNISTGKLLPELLESRKDEIRGTQYAEIFRSACMFDPIKRLTSSE